MFYQNRWVISAWMQTKNEMGPHLKMMYKLNSQKRIIITIIIIIIILLFFFFRSVRPPRRFVFTTTVVIIVETEKIPSCRGARWCERLCKHATLSLPWRTQWKYIWMVHKSYKAIPLCQGRKRLLCQTEADYYTSAGGDKSSQITTFFGGGEI